MLGFACLLKVAITDPVMSGEHLSRDGCINTLFVEGLPVSFSHLKMPEALSRFFHIETFELSSELNSDRECAVTVVHFSNGRLSSRRHSNGRLSNLRFYNRRFSKLSQMREEHWW